MTSHFQPQKRRYYLPATLTVFSKFRAGILCFLLLAVFSPHANANSETRADTFQITAGLNDAWFNPATNGQGFFITVFPDLGKVSLAWFTYDSVRPPNDVEAVLGDPGHRWLTGLGDFSGDRADMVMEFASGGLFDTATEISRRTEGTISLTFSSCNEGSVAYSIPSLGLSGTVPIQRVTTDNVAECEQTSATAQTTQSVPVKSDKLEAESFTINTGLNDAWFNPATDGQGFFITVFPSLEKVSLAWFTYDSVRPPDDVEAVFGEPDHRWLTALGDFSGDRADMVIEIASGGVLDTPTEISRRNDGTITLTFNDCSTGQVEYDIPSINRQGTVPIQRIVNDNVIRCEQSVDTAVNAPPVAEAGANQVVLGGSLVNLVGERSTDADGPLKSVRWEQLSGPQVSLLSATSLNARFIAPDVSGTPDNPDAATSLSFRLIVWDEQEVFDIDTVTISVQPANLKIAMQRVSGNGSENPELFLLDQDGNVLENAQGSNILINENLPAGVYYAVSTADSAIDLDVQISASTGLNLVRTIRPAEMNGVFSFINTTAFEQVDIQPLLVNADFGMGYGHRQFMEFTLKDPDPALRDPDEFLQFTNEQSLRFYEDAATATAYYEAVDPIRDRLNLDDWLFANGFNAGADAHATYQNDADLGFGRDMYARINDENNIASYVRNFPSVEHAVAEDSLIATVAMEYGPPEGGGAPIVKFFAFGPDGSRILAADLDGRGAKFIPGLCNVCHGGQPKRLTTDESGKIIYPDNGDTQAQFLPWDLETFKYAKNRPDLSRTAQEPEFRKLNGIALATYPAVAPASGQWTGAAAKDLINGWYNDFNRDTFDENYVPQAWQQQRDLYLDVFAPNCRACHINRGTNLQNAIDFGSYDKFIGYAPLIRNLVFEQGVMPLAVRTFGHFWAGGNNSAARKLAEALPDDYGLVFNANRSSGAKSLAKPGRPIARTGMMAKPFPSEFVVTGKANEVILDGRASLFPTTQDMLVSSLNLDPEIVDQRGDLAITTQSNIEGQESSRLVRHIAGPGEVRRTRFIRAQLAQNNPLEPRTFLNYLWPKIQQDCVGCHKPDNLFFPGIPVFFYTDLGTDDADSEYMYRNVLERIDFDDPANSLMLTKPGGFRHAGGTIPGWEYFTPPPEREVANSSDRGISATILMDWVQSGARFDSNQQVKICRDTGFVIPDNSSTGIRDRIFVGPASKISDLSVRINLDHERVGDLTIRLRHVESGQSVSLLNRQCGSASNVIGTFDDNGSSNSGICNNNGVSNQFRPASPLSALDGGLVNGFWELQIKDLSPDFTGNLKQWCLINSVP